MNKKLYIFLMIILSATIVFSTVKLVKIGLTYYKGTQYAREIVKIAHKETKKGQTINWEELKNINPEVIGWIKSPDTVIDYPIMQAKDNNKYLYERMDGTWDIKGSIFVDANSKTPFKGFNTVIYGHRMKDGSMFHSLTHYQEEGYYKQHPYFYIYTPDGIIRTIEVVMSGVVPANSPLYNSNIADEKEKQAFIDELKKADEIPDKHNLADINIKDNFILLSTCTHNLKNSRRLVVGKIISEHKE